MLLGRSLGAGQLLSPRSIIVVIDSTGAAFLFAVVCSSTRVGKNGGRRWVMKKEKESASYIFEEESDLITSRIIGGI